MPTSRPVLGPLLGPPLLLLLFDGEYEQDDELPMH